MQEKDSIGNVGDRNTGYGTNDLDNLAFVLLIARMDRQVAHHGFPLDADNVHSAHIASSATDSRKNLGQFTDPIFQTKADRKGIADTRWRWDSLLHIRCPHKK